MKIAARTIQNRYCFFDRLQIRFLIDFDSLLATIWAALGRLSGQKSSKGFGAQAILHRLGQNFRFETPRRPHLDHFPTFFYIFLDFSRIQPPKRLACLGASGFQEKSKKTWENGPDGCDLQGFCIFSHVFLDFLGGHKFSKNCKMLVNHSNLDHFPTLFWIF